MERPAPDHPGQRIRELHFVAGARLLALQDVEHLGSEDVASDDRQGGGRIRRLRLLDQAADFRKTAVLAPDVQHAVAIRSEEHTSELQSLMRISYAVFCLKQNNHKQRTISNHPTLQ